uniref:Major facilitator superfamily (MFS) profile domain-containing protein n=2 Tax=Pseudoalteromonas rubra TaxID=43658 RepID=A0A0F4QHB2_9GAMM|nr:hypothetical protein TW77_18105 [Pseudoalteromonas rubra]
MNIYKKLHLLTVLSGVASGLTAPIIYIFILDKGIDISDLGILITVVSLTMVLFEVPLGLFADRYGKSLTYTLSLIFNVLFSFGVFYFNDFIYLLLCMIFAGLAMSLASGTIEAMLINGIEEQENKSIIVQKNVANLKSARVVGIVIGAVVSLIASIMYLYYPSYFTSFDYMEFGFIAMGAMYIIQMPIALSVKDEPFNRRESTSPTFLSTLSHSIVSVKKDKITRTLMLSTLLFAMGVIAIEKFWQIRLSELIEERSLPWLFSVAFICSSLTSLAGHILSVHICRFFSNNFNSALVGCRLVCGTAYFAIFLSESILMFIICLLVVNFAFSASQSLLSTLLHENIENSRRTTLLSYLSCFNQVGGMIGIAVMALVVSGNNISYVFMASGIVIILSAGFHMNSIFEKNYCPE